MDRFLKFLAGLLLLPFCYATTIAFIALLQSIQPDSPAAIPWSVRGLAIGFALWIFLYMAMPRPIRSYVLAHELTHALWGWVMGARIKRLKISRQGGSVTLSKSNFIVELAPYFFPLYTVVAIGLVTLARLVWPSRTVEVTGMALIGISWGFHFCFTVNSLLQHQTDIERCGYVFSYLDFAGDDVPPPSVPADPVAVAPAYTG